MNFVGFTGTQRGMTYDQKRELSKLFADLGRCNLAHGGCVGADEQARNLALPYIDSEVIFPASYPQGKGMIFPRLWEVTHEITVHRARPSLERNRLLVEVSDMLFACPGEEKEVVRSGTWATVRYAKKNGCPVTIIYPDGEIEYVS